MLNMAKKMKITPMELIELGFDRWFEDQARELCKPDQRIARVTVVDRGWYIVRNEDGEVPARATGKFLHSTESTSDMPCVGDWVCVQYHDSGESASIHTVLPRKSFLRRKSAGKDIEFQMIAANIDVAFIVQSCHFDFNVPRLERYLVMVREGQVEPLLILSKTDLISADDLAQLILNHAIAEKMAAHIRWKFRVAMSSLKVPDTAALFSVTSPNASVPNQHFKKVKIN